MIRQRGRAVLSPVFLCLSAATASAAAQTPIQVYVDASGRRDATVPDASMLTATIDGKPAKILSVRPATNDKLLFAVMLDISSSGRNQQKAMKEAALRIFQALTNQQSQGYFALFNVQTYESKRPLQPSEAQTILDHASFTGGTSVYDSVAQIATGILSRSANPGTPRRLIILLSDGEDNYSKMTFDAMQKAVHREGISVFLLSQEANDMPSKTRVLLMGDFARNSGGNAIIDETMPAGVPALIAAVSGQVELTLAPPETPGDELHSFSLKTSEKHVSIAAPDHILIPVSR
jgi:hypothetical protein